MPLRRFCVRLGIVVGCVWFCPVAKAQGDPPAVDLQPLLKQAIKQAGSDPERNAYHFVIGINTTALMVNPRAVDSYRDAVRDLFNQFLVEGDRVTVFQFQWRPHFSGQGAFDFSAERRQQQYSQVPNARIDESGYKGGSDIHAAQLGVMRQLRQQDGDAIVILLSNWEAPQPPINHPELRDVLSGAEARREYERLQSELGAQWKRQRLLSSDPSDPRNPVWVFSLVPDGVKGLRPLDPGRTESVRQQNERWPLIARSARGEQPVEPPAVEGPEGPQSKRRPFPWLMAISVLAVLGLFVVLGIIVLSPVQVEIAGEIRVLQLGRAVPLEGGTSATQKDAVNLRGPGDSLLPRGVLATLKKQPFGGAVLVPGDYAPQTTRGVQAVSMGLPRGEHRVQMVRTRQRLDPATFTVTIRVGRGTAAGGSSSAR